LALSLVEGLAGRPVIDGDQSAMMGTALDANRRPTPRSEGVQVTDAVENVFQRAMALDPRERHRDAGEFWKALKAAAFEPTSAERPGAGSPNLGETLLDPSEVIQAATASLDLDIDPSELVASLRRPVSARSNAASPAPAAPASPAAAVSIRTAPAPVPRPRVPYVAPPPSLLRELVPAAMLVGSSIVATVVDQAYAANTGQLLSVGPLRASWVATLLLLIGLGHGAVRLIARRG
jgi:serine/threonine-protein kinase